MLLCYVTKQTYQTVKQDVGPQRPPLLLEVVESAFGTAKRATDPSCLLPEIFFYVTNLYS